MDNENIRGPITTADSEKSGRLKVDVKQAKIKILKKLIKKLIKSK